MWSISKHQNPWLNLTKFVFGCRKIVKSMFKLTPQLRKGWRSWSYNSYNIRKTNWEKMLLTPHF